MQSEANPNREPQLTMSEVLKQNHVLSQGVNAFLRNSSCLIVRPGRKSGGLEVELPVRIVANIQTWVTRML